MTLRDYRSKEEGKLVSENPTYSSFTNGKELPS
jgi:hypothetical protein